jgi:1-hydroxy-2-isopentenylcarotenoid 3,4-desaturase
MAKRVVIVGAGVGGMATAGILARQGYDVHVYEKNDGPGGRMGLLEKQGFRFDTGPSWYLMPEVFEQYFRLFGKRPSDFYTLEKLSPAYKVFYDYADSITITGDLKKDARTFEHLESGSGVQLEKYIREAQKTYELALRQFLYNPFRSMRASAPLGLVPKLPRLLFRLLRPLHGYVAGRFQDKRLQQILEYPMVFLGASPFNAPAMYSLMSYLDFKQGVFYPSGGMYEVTKALYDLSKSQGVTYHFGEPVEKIVTKYGKVVGVSVDGKVVAAEMVVSNADLHFTEMQLLETTDRTYPAKYWDTRAAGPSALLLYLGVKGELPQLEHHNLFFVDAWKENFADIYDEKAWPEHASMYVCKPSATDTTVAPKHHENVFVLVPLPAGVSKDSVHVETYVDHYLSSLEKLSGIHDLRERIMVREIRDPEYFSAAFHAWQNTALGMSHTLRQSAMFRPSVQSKKVSGLYYVGGGTQPGIGVPMCLISAELVYKAVVNDVSAGPLKNLESTK